MWGLALTVALAASPDAIRLASPGLTPVGLPKELVTFYSDHLAQQLSLQGLAVMTATEVNSLLGLERQKQLLGCSDEETAACMAELANALGVDGIVTGTIALVGARYRIDLKVASAANARTLALYSGSAETQPQVLSTLVDAAVLLDKQLRLRLRDSVAAESGGSSGGVSKYWWAPGAVGVLGLGIGAALMGFVAGAVNTLSTATSAQLTYADAVSLRTSASNQQVGAIVAFSVGGAGLVAAAVMAFVPGPVTVAPSISSSGAGVSLLARWP